jgi:hypothetical protein
VIMSGDSMHYIMLPGGIIKHKTFPSVGHVIRTDQASMFEWHNNGGCMSTFVVSRNRTVAVEFPKLFLERVLFCR